VDKLAIALGLNGLAVLAISLFAGLFLYLALLHEDDSHGWHLLHAGGSGRGVMLMALAGIVHLVALPEWLVSLAAWAIVYFVWASTIAMVITAVTGEHGFGFSGPLINRFAHLLYVTGAAAVFPGVFVLGYGFLTALFR
jgi:hypothetical protein